MGDPARKLTAADERRAAILALPLRAEPETEEERALFDEAEQDLRAGRGGGHTTEQILATIDQGRRNQSA